MSIRRILVPVDGSRGARAALALALELAEATGARLSVLQVIEDAGPLPSYDEDPPEGQERVPWLADQRWEKTADLLAGTDVAHERRVETGYAAERICQVAAEEDVDLIVVGSRGLSLAGRFLLGSVSDRVVHHAPCSVTVVREPS